MNGPDKEDGVLWTCPRGLLKPPLALLWLVCSYLLPQLLRLSHPTVLFPCPSLRVILPKHISSAYNPCPIPEGGFPQPVTHGLLSGSLVCPAAAAAAEAAAAIPSPTAITTTAGGGTVWWTVRIN